MSQNGRHGLLVSAEETFNRLKEKRDRRKTDRAAAFAALEQKFTADAVKTFIVDLPHDELISKLQSRELKAVQVLSAYVWKALEVTKRSNCVTEFHPKMMEWAEDLDKLPEVKGPLHGLPFCVKDDTDLVEMDTTCGASKLLDDPKEKSAVLVQLLVDFGGIPFCKTNLCQGVFSYGSENPIFGKTTNPLNNKRSPGGSSSGTGCLVAAGGTCFGTGSDIAGSLRMPSHFCGAFTMLPTQFRNSVRGVRQIQPDESAGLHGQPGFIASNAKLLADLYKLAWKDSIQSTFDAAVVPVPWNNELFESKKSLKIGYYTSLPFFPTIGDTPGIVLKAKERLEALGHVLVNFEMPDTWDLMKVFSTLSTADGLNHGFRMFEHDEISPVAEIFVNGRDLQGRSERAPETFPSTKETTRDAPPDPEAGKSDVLWDYLKKQRELRNDLLDKMKVTNVDAFLTPVLPFPACGVDDCVAICGAWVYTCIWNLYGFPAGVIPFGTESGQLISSYDDQGDSVLRLAKESMKDAAGLPIGVQIIGKPWKDEMVLRLMCDLAPYSTFSRGAVQARSAIY